MHCTHKKIARAFYTNIKTMYLQKIKLTNTMLLSFTKVVDKKGLMTAAYTLFKTV